MLLHIAHSRESVYKRHNSIKIMNTSSISQDVQTGKLSNDMLAGRNVYAVSVKRSVRQRLSELTV